MHSVFYSVLPIFLIAMLGSIIRRKWLTSDEFWRGLEKLSFYLLFPAVLFQGVSKIDLVSFEVFRLVSALVVATLLISAALIFYQVHQNYNRVQFTSVFQGATRYNNYIFFALGAALFGSEGLAMISIISPYMIVVTNVTAVFIFAYYIPKKTSGISRRHSFLLMIKSIISNPLIIASILGFACNYFKMNLNPGIQNTIKSLADSALSIGIIIVGASLKFKINPEHLRQVMFTSSIKLLIMPIVTFVILWSMSISGTAKSIGVLYSCLPCASTSYILSRQLGGDPETMSSIITFTTIFSILSLSLLMYILG
jgi:malonate transporter and related proteins